MSCKRGLLKIKLKVEVRDKHGKLIETREKEGDLILDNFKAILSGVLYPFGSISENTWRTVSVVDVAGTARSIAVFSTANTDVSGDGANFLARRYSASDLGAWIGVGTSTVTPTRGDYKLGAQVAWGSPSQTVGADYISWAVSLVLEAAADIAEAGLALYCIVDGWGAPPTFKNVFLFRDTFTPISVPAGGTISVTYTLKL